MQIGRDGLNLLGQAVLPVLFPFFVLTALIINLSTTNRPWLVAGLAYLSGYPNGARLTQTLYNQGRIDLETARDYCVITSTPSPIFVIATIGTWLLHDTKTGVIIFLCAVLGALCNGLIWRSRKTTSKLPMINLTKTPVNFLSAFNQALTSSISAIINVCGVVLFFYILAKLLQLPPLVAGLLEMTTGATSTTNLYLIQFIVSFGGLSIAMQHQLFMENFRLKFHRYLLFKFTHGLIACGLLSIYLLLFN